MELLHKLGLPLAAALWITKAAAHEEAIEVGHNSAGKIVVRLDFPQPIELAPSVFPGISGYATGEFGIHSVVADDPAENIFQFVPEADFRFVLLNKDPGMEVWNDSGSAFMGIGDSFYVGVAPFDTHPVWNLVDGTNDGSHSLSLKIRDLKGVYLESDAFELSFTPLSPVRLEIAAGLQSIILRWPTNGHDWELQTAEALQSQNWSTVTNAPEVVGTNLSITLSSSSSAQFFRLYRP